MTYDADAQVGAWIASVGQRLLDTSARAIVRQSLDGLRDNIKLRADAYREHVDHADTLRTEKLAVPSVPPITYKRAEASQLAAAVTKEVARTFVLLPALLACCSWRSPVSSSISSCAEHQNRSPMIPGSWTTTFRQASTRRSR